MSLALGHFAFGAALTVLCVSYLVPTVPYPRVVALLGGVWAMVPDAYRLLPVGTEPIRALHGSPLSNVFWFHHLLDAIDATDSKAFAAATVAFLVVVTALAERREYRALAAVRERF